MIKRFSEYTSVNEKVGSKLFSDLYGQLNRRTRKIEREWEVKYPPDPDHWDYNSKQKYNRFGVKYGDRKVFDSLKSSIKLLSDFADRLKWQQIDPNSLDDSQIEVLDSSDSELNFGRLINKKGDEKFKLRRKPYNNNNYIIIGFMKRTDGSLLKPMGWFIKTDSYHAHTRNEILNSSNYFWIINIEKAKQATHSTDMLNKRDERSSRKQGTWIPGASGYNNYNSNKSNFDANIKKANIERYSKQLAGGKTYRKFFDRFSMILKMLHEEEMNWIEKMQSIEHRKEWSKYDRKPMFKTSDFPNLVNGENKYWYFSGDKSRSVLIKSLFSEFIDAFSELKDKKSGDTDVNLQFMKNVDKDLDIIILKLQEEAFGFDDYERDRGI